jgi:hypothetical protein
VKIFVNRSFQGIKENFVLVVEGNLIVAHRYLSAAKVVKLMISTAFAAAVY